MNYYAIDNVAWFEDPAAGELAAANTVVFNNVLEGLYESLRGCSWPTWRPLFAVTDFANVRRSQGLRAGAAERLQHVHAHVDVRRPRSGLTSTPTTTVTRSSPTHSPTCSASEGQRDQRRRGSSRRLLTPNDTECRATVARQLARPCRHACAPVRLHRQCRPALVGRPWSPSPAAPTCRPCPSSPRRLPSTIAGCTCPANRAPTCSKLSAVVMQRTSSQRECMSVGPEELVRRAGPRRPTAARLSPDVIGWPSRNAQRKKVMKLVVSRSGWVGEPVFRAP